MKFTAGGHTHVENNHQLVCYERCDIETVGKARCTPQPSPGEPGWDPDHIDIDAIKVTEKKRGKW